jgi:protein involved in polysaccharide export with SLBB domain
MKTKQQQPGVGAAFVIGFLALILLMNFSAVYGTQKIGSSNEFYPGDAVRISVIELDRSPDRKTIDINGDYTINSMGQIMLPIVGNVKVVGYDRIGLSKQLVELYSPYLREPYIATTPMIRVTLMGSFNRPGAYRINPESSLWQLVEMAEGPKENCDLNSIRVERGGKVVIKNLLSQFERGYSLQDIGIKSGDQIFSENRSSFGFRDIMNYTYFVMTAVSLYFSIKNYSN